MAYMKKMYPQFSWLCSLEYPANLKCGLDEGYIFQAHSAPGCLGIYISLSL